MEIDLQTCGDSFLIPFYGSLGFRLPFGFRDSGVLGIDIGAQVTECLSGWVHGGGVLIAKEFAEFSEVLRLPPFLPSGADSRYIGFVQIAGNILVNARGLFEISSPYQSREGSAAGVVQIVVVREELSRLGDGGVITTKPVVRLDCENYFCLRSGEFLCHDLFLYAATARIRGFVLRLDFLVGAGISEFLISSHSRTITRRATEKLEPCFFSNSSMILISVSPRATLTFDTVWVFSIFASFCLVFSTIS